MKGKTMKYTMLILAALLVLSVVGTAGAQDIDGAKRFISRYDLAAPWRVIDVQDVWPLHLAFNRTPGDYVPLAWDIDRDGIISTRDINSVAVRVGCTAEDDCYWR